jgi:hypothetical protein
MATIHADHLPHENCTSNVNPRNIMKKQVIILGVAAALSAAPTMAQKGAVGAKVGTLGLGIEYSMPIKNRYKDKLSARVGFNSYSIDRDLDESGVKYDADFTLRSFAAIADYHPTGNGFRLSGGAIYNATDLDVTAKPSSGSYTFNDVTYNAADIGSATGSIDFKGLKPYVGIGYSSGPLRKSTGLSFTAELGAMYLGSPDTSLSVVCGATLDATQCSKLQSDVAAERVQLEKELDDFKWYPVVSVGLEYKF